MQSIISYPERGPWGDSKWRGNCSGFVYRDLFEQFNPLSFVDPMVGSGTSVQVAKEMNIEAYGLDLHMGFNAIRDSILHTVGKQVDMCLSHPPYGDMIVYSGNVWGSEAHPDDLSRCSSVQEFNDKMQAVLLNQRDATKPGAIYGTIIGDHRTQGAYHSYQAELLCRMPSEELLAVLIKQQHNCVSNSRRYNRFSLPRIAHEFVLLWRKKSAPILVLLSNIARQQQARLTGTWKAIVNVVLQRLGGKASLSEIYAEVQRAAPQRMATNPNWQAKVRQTLQMGSAFRSCERGVWQMV